MSIIAEYAVAPDRLTLSEAIGVVPEVTLDIERAYATNPERPHVFIWASAERIEVFDAALEDDETVADAEQISEMGGDRLYRIQPSDTPVVTYEKWVEAGGERLKAYYDDGWWHARTRYPDREALSEYRGSLQDNDVTFRLERLYDAGYRDTDGPILTPEQREALELAHEHGYFEIPRAVSTDKLADEVGVSKQAVSERLRRGNSRLLEDVLR